MLFACKYWISPSGFPPLHVISDDGIVRLILLPETPLKTSLSPTEPPKFIIFGKLNVGIQKITSNVVGDYVKTSATILVTDADHLNRLIDNISKVKSVVNIDRVMK